LIIDINQTFGGKQEKLVLTEGVKAEGNIEDWLVKLESEM